MSEPINDSDLYQQITYRMDSTIMIPLTLIVWIANTVYQHQLAATKTDQLKKNIGFNKKQLSKLSLYIGMQIPTAQLKGQLHFAQSMEIIFLLISSNILRKAQETNNKNQSLLSDTYVSQYYDFSFGLSFYWLIFFQIINIHLILMLTKSQITYDYNKNVFISILLCNQVFLNKAIVKFASEINRYSTPIIKDLQFMLLTSDIIIIMIQLKLDMVNSQQFSDKSDYEDHQKQITYQEFYQDLQEMDDDDILENIEIRNKAFDAYHVLKSYRISQMNGVLVGRNFFIYTLFMFLVFVVATVYNELNLLFIRANPFFNSSTIYSIFDEGKIFEHDTILMGTDDNEVAKPDIILIILSGLSFKKSQESPAFKEFFNQISNVEKDARMYTLKTEIPTNYFNNWMTMFSGLKTEINGYYGNQLVNENFEIDNIAERCYSQDDTMNFLISGNKFFESMIQIYFPTAQVSQITQDQKILQLIKSKQDIMYKLDSQLKNIADTNNLQAQQYNQIKKQTQNKLEFLQTVKKKFEQDGITEKLLNQIKSDYNQLYINVKNKRELRKLIKKSQFLTAQIDTLQNLSYLHGVDSQIWEEKMKFLLSVLKKSMLESENSVFLITSDSGLKGYGYQGGNDEEMSHIPLIVYKKGSNFADSIFTMDFDKLPIPIKDFAPTLALLLGIQVPFNSMGKLIPEIIQVIPRTQDQNNYCYNQNKYIYMNFITFYLQKINEDDEIFNDIHRRFSRNLSILNKESIYEELEYFDKIYDITSRNYKVQQLQYRAFYNISFLFVSVYITALITQHYTVLDPLGIIFGNNKSYSRRYNVDAMKTALYYYCFFFAIAIFQQQFYYRVIKGFEKFDISICSTPLRLSEFFIINLVIPFLLSIVYLKLPFIINCKWKYPSFLSRLRSKIANTTFQGQEWEQETIIPDQDKTTIAKYMTWSRLNMNIDNMDFYEDAMAKIFLMRTYFLLICIFFNLMIIVLQSGFRDIFQISKQPHSFFLYDYWDQRFIMASISLINTPYIIIGISSLYYWPQWTSSRQIFDRVYLLKEFKSDRNLFTVREKEYINLNMAVFFSKFARQLTNFDMISEQCALISTFEQRTENYLYLFKSNFQIVNDDQIRKVLLRESLKIKERCKLDLVFRHLDNKFIDDAAILQKVVYDILVEQGNRVKEQ